MKKCDDRVNRSLFSLRTYLIFLLLVSSTVTCCFLLFLRHMGFEDGERLRESAALTFVNVLFLALLFSTVDSLRHRFTVERPVRSILDATRRITAGDFSARIAPLHGPGSMNEIDAIIEDFNRMAAELSGIETLRADFISGVSHELKTPLAVIQSYAALLESPGLGEERRIEYARAVAAAARRLSGLVTNILRLNKLENQQIFPERTRFDLGEQLRECLLGFEEAWEEKKLAIETEIDDIIITADAELLSVVWNNLISNAVKFTPPGGTLRVSLRGEGGWVVTEVADTGCGMTPEVGRRIFEKFYQGDPSRAAQGNGLGLALVRRVVDILGGEISVESAAGRGSTFTVRLPEAAL